MINELDNPGIKCFVLTNSECPSCQEWIDDKYEAFKGQFPSVTWKIIDCYEQQQNGSMPFPPLVSPTFYFYKDKKDFPLISQGIMPDFEMSKSFANAIRILENE